MIEFLFELIWHIYHLTNDCLYIPLWGIISAENALLDPYIDACTARQS